MRVVEADLAELDLELLADLDRQGRRDLLQGPAVEDTEVVEMLVVLPDEEEAPARRLLQLAQARAARARE